MEEEAWPEAVDIWEAWPEAVELCIADELDIHGIRVDESTDLLSKSRLRACIDNMMMEVMLMIMMMRRALAWGRTYLT